MPYQKIAAKRADEQPQFSMSILPRAGPINHGNTFKSQPQQTKNQPPIGYTGQRILLWVCWRKVFSLGALDPAINANEEQGQPKCSSRFSTDRAGGQ